MHRNSLCAIAGLMALAGLAPAQGQPAAPFVVHQLKPNVYWVEGGGGNSGVIVGDNGVIVIDAKTSAAGGKELVDDIAKITTKPIAAVILTHSDGDHVNGLASFPAGVKVIAHENNRKEQEAALSSGGRGAPPADHLPSQLISKDKDSLKIEGVSLELYHWSPAHTSGDLVVYLPADRIVFTGDIIATQQADPIIHAEKNGSSEGWITTVKGIVALNSDQFVPGHGDLQTKAMVQKRLADTESKRTKIKDMVGQGKSLDEIRAALDTPSAPAGGGPGGGGPGGAPGGGGPGGVGRGGSGGGGGRGGGFASFTQVVYQELTKK
jgi:glyoxylase-like metal-dependent hydrolase (beta-lactamase superfamily II)